MKNKKRPLWFAAHALLYAKTKNRRLQRTYVVFENVYLIRAATPAEARSKAAKHARLEATANDDSFVNGIPAKLVFAGIRKVVSCAGDPQRSAVDVVTTVHDGIEATYSRFVVTGRERLKKLLRGAPTSVIYEE